MFIKEWSLTKNTEKLFYVRKIYPSDCETVDVGKGRLDTFDPVTTTSTNYKNWRALLDLKTCLDCRLNHGQIYEMDEAVNPEPPLHDNCRCDIIPMESIVAGNATQNGDNGADYWLKHIGELPGYYVSKDDAYRAGRRDGKSPIKYIPNKMISAGIYENQNGHLPDAPGRV